MNTINIENEAFLKTLLPFLRTCSLMDGVQDKRDFLSRNGEIFRVQIPQALKNCESWVNLTSPKTPQHPVKKSRHEESPFGFDPELDGV